MKETYFVILGLLKESPKTPYQIKKEIKELVSVLVGIKATSIYYSLRSMENKRWVEKFIERKKNLSLRYVYTITPLGEHYFYQFLYKSFLNFQRPTFSLDLCLYFMKYLKPKIIQRRIKARIFIVKKLIKEMKHAIEVFKNEKPSSLKMLILQHDLKMVETEEQFLLYLLKKYFKK